MSFTAVAWIIGAAAIVVGVIMMMAGAVAVAVVVDVASWPSSESLPIIETCSSGVIWDARRFFGMKKFSAACKTFYHGLLFGDQPVN
jgi:hypothetical protein